MLKASDGLLLLLIGAIIWIAGTIYFAHFGPAVLETTGPRYWRTFVLCPVTSTLLCVAILQWRRIPAAHWTAAMLLLAIPGMIGEAIVLTHFSAFMPRLQAASGGRYGAFLFASYALALGVAEFVTLRAAV